ncbi:rRNA adenine N-6-methyltransferase family protein [Nocardia acidivorans]|uniref:rRNA adenine N-6-methyltransferase family protein n=1 Tax=Nocardia acidivorans TaxID=404580 RepID=UPI000834167A|nr:methyltransferase domain-containing protein [Nocardia acidivorans]
MAAEYAEHRPDYAVPAVRWALAPAPGVRVVDLGAGTGKLTRTLAEVGAEVIAVEPDSAMSEELRATLATRAGVLVMPERERRGTLDRIRAYLASRPETAEGEFMLPMLTGVLRVRRL